MPKIYRKPPPNPSECRLSPAATIATLGRSPLLDAVSGIELVVYLRLLGAIGSGNDEERKIKIENAHLYREPRTAGKALLALCELKLIRMVTGPQGRVIEVLR